MDARLSVRHVSLRARYYRHTFGNIEARPHTGSDGQCPQRGV